MSVCPSLSNLPRFTLSVILSYLQQSPHQTSSNVSRSSTSNDAPFPLPHNRDALSFLLTTKRLSYAILPLFRVPRHACRNYQYQTEDGTLIAVIEKYRFLVLPVQDPRTLLNRLNTRRLRGRISLVKKLEIEKSKEDETEEGIEAKVKDSCTIQTELSTQQQPKQQCYQYGRTIEELALEEWMMMQINHEGDELPVEGSYNQWRIWPAHLELLRFLDDHRNHFVKEARDDGKRQNNSITASFRFLSKSNRQHRVKNTKSEVASTDICEQIFDNEITLLASYPRSGNTLLRTLLERITSIVTGSDTRPDRTLSKSLALEHDLVGEGLVGSNKSEANTTKTSQSSAYLQNIYQSAYDPNAHIVKTHFPERKGWKPIKGSRVLLLVRNPYDAIDSYWNLCCTNTHTRTLEESVYAKYAEKFEGLARHEINIWCEFHYYWIDICEKEGVPLLIVRYEDLVMDIEAEMGRIMKFLFGQKHCAKDGKLNSFWEWRNRHALGKTTKEPAANGSSQAATCTSTLGSYKPRSSKGGLHSIGKSIRKKRYSEAVLLHMHDVAVSMELERKQSSKRNRNQPNQTLLQRFGYDIYTQQFPENFNQPTPIVQGDVQKRKNGTIVINKSLEIRRKDDPYGRVMTNWRRGETMGDTKPFPTIPR